MSHFSRQSLLASHLGAEARILTMMCKSLQNIPHVCTPHLYDLISFHSYIHFASLTLAYLPFFEHTRHVSTSSFALVIPSSWNALSVSWPVPSLQVFLVSIYLATFSKILTPFPTKPHIPLACFIFSP